MKPSIRIASGVLAAALAVGCVLPAFAAETQPDLQKKETVYAVLEQDGSIRSQTVSEHLYSRSGLASVQDRSTLTNIQNTQTEAAFAQDGETLVWQTDDTDVYYKGTSDRQLPVTAQITYTLDGETASAQALAGKSGHLVMEIALTNQETGTVEVDGTAYPVCTPFITAVGVTFGEDAENVVAAHGTLQQVAGSQIAAFVCLPGVKACVDGLLPAGVSDIEDYLLDTVTVEADVTDFAAPGVMIACAADVETLEQSTGESGLEIGSLKGLADDMEALSDAMAQLMDGAAGLTDGAQQLLDGAAQLNDGTATLLDGAKQLSDGAVSLENGLETLASNNDALCAGAQQIADGVLASANSQLLESGLITAPLTWENYEQVLDEALSINENTLAATRKKMLKTIHASAPSFPDDQLDLALYLAATQTNGDVAAALEKLSSNPALFVTGAAQMKLDANAETLIHDCLVQTAADSQDLADVRALKENLSQIAYFVRSVGQYTDGVAAAADGSVQLADGLGTLYSGAQSLSTGADALQSGTAQLADGTVAMENGLGQLNDEAIAPLTGAVSADQLRILGAVAGEMQERLEAYRSFAGAPEDADVKLLILQKTAEAPAENAAATATAAENTVKLTFWQRLVALFKSFFAKA
jgi:putative membrane protein